LVFSSNFSSQVLKKTPIQRDSQHNCNSDQNALHYRLADDPRPDRSIAVCLRKFFLVIDALVQLVRLRWSAVTAFVVASAALASAVLRVLRALSVTDDAAASAGAVPLTASESFECAARSGG